MHLKRISLAFASVLMISSSLATSAFAETTIRRNVTASVSAETTAAAESTSADTSNTASNNAGTGEVSSPNEHIPSTVNNVTVPENLDLDSVVANAGFGNVGNGNTNPEPVLGETQMVHYVLRNAAGQDISAAESRLL